MSKVFKKLSKKKKWKAKERKKAITEFELMTKKAKLNALSKVSLKRPLKDREFKEMKRLFKDVYKK